MQKIIEKIKKWVNEGKEIDIYIRLRKSGNIRRYFTFYKSGLIIADIPCWLGDKFHLHQVLGAPIVGDATKYYIYDDDKFDIILRYIFRRFDVREVHQHISGLKSVCLWKKQ